MLSEYVGVLLMLGIALSLTLGVLAVQVLLGWRRGASQGPEPSREREPSREPEPSRAQGPEPSREREPSLASEPPSVPARPSEATGLHLLAILLVVFGAAAVFFYPWGATFAETGVAGCVAIAVFALPLAVAWLYAWRKGAFEW